MATYQNFEIIQITEEEFKALVNDDSVIRASSFVKSQNNTVYGKALISEGAYYATAPEDVKKEWALQKASVHCQNRIRRHINPDLQSTTTSNKEKVKALNSSAIGKDLLNLINDKMSNEEIKEIMRELCKKK